MTEYLKTKASDNIIVSVVVPVYNEEKYIGTCINSLLSQDYPITKMEWIFVDGKSSDKTFQVIEEYRYKYPALIRVFENPDKTVPFSMNIGIKSSTGKYIVRLDAHSEYPYDYISKCVHYLDTIDADNVGGWAETKSKGFIGNAIAMMLSCRFGVGNSQFRTNKESGYVDTVPFGAFRREVFENYGLYDTRLTRNQDNEMNFRIRSNGGKIYMASDISLSYYCRDTLSGIIDMALKNGKWNVITMILCPGSMGIRHFIPLLFLLSLVVLPALALVLPFFWWVLKIEIATYAMLDVYFSIKAAKEPKYLPILIILFPLFHISYGLGSLIALLSPKITKNKTTAKV